MTYKPPTKKQAERFQKNATDRLIRLGFKKVEGGPRDFCLDTPLGQLWASPYDDWIACRFDNLELAKQHAERNITHPREIEAGRFYSNGKLGNLWSVRQVLGNSATDPASDGTVRYQVLAGDGMHRSGQCSVAEFRQWARFEVQPQGNGRWFKRE